ncbi:MAG TPA: beta-L-arabinofuranosidase domain-containing protein [Bryobacteraceae bacterium]|nr:beta-L-arabinofuranosidase domain-containing protein [Bryobacteraceae bacterium]
MRSRRSFLTSGLAAAVVGSHAADTGGALHPLQEFGYKDVELSAGPAQAQFEQTQSVLMGLNEDSLLKPWRLRAGLPAPGPDLGGWYDEVPLVKTESGGHGFAPAHCFGQWLSALARGYAVSHDLRARAKLERLLDLYGAAIAERFYVNFRFPAYNYDKMVIGLIDAQRFAGLTTAFELLDRTTAAAEPHLPPRALDRDEPQRRWRKSVGENTTDDYLWDESYTLAENLYLAWDRGAGERYRTMARRFLLNETYFDPLAEGKNTLANHHAYSFCNALSSAMQAYLADGSAKHLRAAKNAFDMIETTQSFATGAWGPNESFGSPESGFLYESLAGTHKSFETPCGSYAHFKLTRYLLRVTRDGRYGDSMERVLYNTVLGARPLQPDGRAFYYSDYHSSASKVYFDDAWPCCSGTLPQVAADYRILIYFRDLDGVYVNLYLPSVLRWTGKDGVQLTLTQGGDYPTGGRITMLVRASRSSDFALHVRIPAWSASGGSLIRINGERTAAPIQKGFATIQRTWRDGDRIDMEIDLPLRVEAIDATHLDTVALVRGPMVLFAIGDYLPSLTRQQLLSAVQIPGQPSWRTATHPGQVLFRPFVDIHEEKYTTYLNVS